VCCICPYGAFCVDHFGNRQEFVYLPLSESRFDIQCGSYLGRCSPTSLKNDARDLPVTRLQYTCSSSSVLVVFVRLVEAIKSSTVPPGPFTRGVEVTVQLKPISRPWWTYLRLSIRRLIVLVLLIGLGLGWMVRSAHTQRDAVTAIRKAGGLVKYDWE
jgi:hypothetical protein